ncbi:MAG: cytochrome c-type biogenesis protein [Steroidobacteraceae bacterium]
MIRVLMALLAMTSLGVHAFEGTPQLSDPVKQRRYETLTHQLRCMQCQNETVADTPAKFAVDIRRQVREMVEAGKSETEVRQYMVERYGEVILFKPLWNAANSWLWLGPGVFLLGGLYVAWRILRRRGELLASDTSEVTDEAERP